MERKEFTTEAAQTLAMLLQQVEEAVGDGVLSTYTGCGHLDVHLRADTFRQLFPTWTIERKSFECRNPYDAVAMVGRARYFTMLAEEDLAAWTPAPAPIA